MRGLHNVPGGNIPPEFYNPGEPLRPDPLSRAMAGVGCLLILGAPLVGVLYAWLT